MKIEVKDKDIYMIWKNPETNEEIGLHPDWYQENGTPITEDGDDYIYERTEIDIKE